MRESAQTKQSAPAGTRIQWLDICRGILIFFVILSHSYPTKLYEQFFTPFFLTMFFFVSGYTFSTKRSFREFFTGKIKRLLIPFLILGLSRVIMYQVLEGGSLLQRLKGFALQINGKYDELWFVSCLFTASLLLYLVVILCRRQKRFPEEHLTLAVSAVFTVLGFLDLCIWKIKFPWELETACMMAFYMALGYWYRRHETGTLCRLEQPACAILLGIFYTGLALLIKNDVNIHTQTFEMPILFVFLSLLVIPPLLSVSKRLSHSGFRPVLVFLGANTLFYYAYAGVIRILFYAGCSYLGIQNEWILPVLCAILSAVFMAPFAWFVKTYLPWVVGGSRRKG